jgi:hypothetical protein
MSVGLEWFLAFLGNFAATTLGVFVALFVQKWWDSLKEAKEAEGMKFSIKDELQKIRKTIMDAHNETKSGVLLSPIKMPVYTGFVNSTKIGLLSRYAWYNRLISLYGTFDTYNSWHNFRSDKSFGAHDVSGIGAMLIMIEKQLLGGTFLEDDADGSITQMIGQLSVKGVK